MKLLYQVCVFFGIFWEISSFNLYSEDNIECPPTMVPYLINENSTEQFCDCEETHLYYPKDDSCYDAYRQGPCPFEHYLALSSGETVAECVKNPCHIDGFVPYRGKCQILWAGGKPCNDNYTYLGVNEDYQIECGQLRYTGSLDDLKRSKSCPKDAYLTSASEDNTHYFCECKPTFLYSAKNNSCYQAYTPGPCPPGQYFVLPLGKNEPQCEKNPCHEQAGLVPFAGGCHELNKSGPPCSEDTELTIDKNTFQLQCSDIYFKVFGVGGIITAPRKACPSGSRRIITRCKRVFQ